MFRVPRSLTIVSRVATTRPDARSSGYKERGPGETSSLAGLAGKDAKAGAAAMAAAACA
jgi:hypothetical protein